jgi:hypothetical protein
MEHPELRRVVDQQISEIFEKSFPNEVRFRASDHLIGKVKKGYERLSGERFDGPDTTSHVQHAFVVGNESANQRFEVTYFRFYSANPEEKITITKNHIEQIRLRTIKYADGRSDGSIEFYDDAPRFDRPISDSFETNAEMATVVVDELAKLLKKMR